MTKDEREDSITRKNGLWCCGKYLIIPKKNEGSEDAIDEAAFDLMKTIMAVGKEEPRGSYIVSLGWKK